MTSFVVGLTTAWQLVLLMIVVMPLMPSSAAYHTPMDKLSLKSNDATISRAASSVSSIGVDTNCVVIRWQGERATCLLGGGGGGGADTDCAVVHQ
jgi:hypothetical protein